MRCAAILALLLAGLNSFCKSTPRYQLARSSFAESRKVHVQYLSGPLRGEATLFLPPRTGSAGVATSRQQISVAFFNNQYAVVHLSLQNVSPKLVRIEPGAFSYKTDRESSIPLARALLPDYRSARTLSDGLLAAIRVVQVASFTVMLVGTTAACAGEGRCGSLLFVLPGLGNVETHAAEALVLLGQAPGLDYRNVILDKEHWLAPGEKLTGLLIFPQLPGNHPYLRMTLQDPE